MLTRQTGEMAHAGDIEIELPRKTHRPDPPRISPVEPEYTVRVSTIAEVWQPVPRDDSLTHVVSAYTRSLPRRIGQEGEQRLEVVGCGAVGHDDETKPAVGIEAHDIPESGAGAEVLYPIAAFGAGSAEPAQAVVEWLAGLVQSAHRADRFWGDDSASVDLTLAEVQPQESAGIQNVAH